MADSSGRRRGQRGSTTSASEPNSSATGGHLPEAPLPQETSPRRPQAGRLPAAARAAPAAEGGPNGEVPRRRRARPRAVPFPAESRAEPSERPLVPGNAVATGARRRARTPPAEADHEQLLRDRAGTNQTMVRLQQFRYVQDFFHNPMSASLSSETSTSAQEATARLTEVKYQLNLLKALQVVLTEEMDTLQQALGDEADKA